MFKKLFASDGGNLKSGVAYAILAIAVACGGYFVYATWTSGDRPLVSTVMCANASCKHVDQRAQEVGEDWPQKCPKCVQQTLFVAFNCRKCAAPNIWNENRGLRPPTRCTQCGQENRHGS